jgi:DNA-binding LytR/AlgR family response regulator
MHGMKILLFGEDERFIDLLIILIHQIGIESIFSVNSKEEYIRQFMARGNEIDLCVIDIDGRDTSDSMQVAKRIRSLNHSTPIILLTYMYNDYCYDQSSAIDNSILLNKNLNKISLRQAIELSVKNKKHHYTEPPIPNKKLKTIFLKVGDKYKVISLEEVTHFYADKKAVYCYAEGRRYLIRSSLKAILDQLDDNYIRIHRSYIINVHRVNTINLVEGTINLDDIELPIGTTYKQNLLNKGIWFK